MKGKITFVVGAAVGYVLGTRAGRERYAQIKRGAQSVWESTPVQRGVGYVREATQYRVDTVKAAAVRAGKSAFTAFVQSDPSRSDAQGPKPTAAAGTEAPQDEASA